MYLIELYIDICYLSVHLFGIAFLSGGTNYHKRGLYYE